MQLHIAGGNLVKKSTFRLDPLTGQWCVNAFVDAPQVRARDCGPARPRGWGRCLRGRVR